MRQQFINIHVPSRLVQLALCGAIGLGCLSSFAQNNAAPLSDPTVDQLVRMLGGSGLTKGIAFRRTQAPDANHLCPEVSSAQGNSSTSGRSKNLEVVAYDVGHSASADLAVQFDPGSDRLKPNDERLLHTLAQALRDPRLERGRFAIAGHTDSTIPDNMDSTRGGAYNRELSCARAISARAYLIANGVAGERLSAYGFGSDSPMANTNSASGVNRRVEIRRDIDYRGN